MIFFCFFLTSLFAIDLRITEVFVDGSDEWIELTNIETGDFLWPLSLHWVKSSPLQLSNISIPAWSSLLVGDNLSMLSSYEWLQLLTGRWLSLWDTSAINVSLFSDSLLLDNFVVDQSLVQSYDNQMTSFHKQRNGLLFDIVPTISSLSWWVNWSILAHPWKVYLSDWSLFWSIVSWDNTQSWSVIEFDLSGWCDVLIANKIQLDEIYSGYEYWQYIEFVSLVDYYWSLSFSGDILSQSIALPTQIRKANTRYILTNNMSWFRHTENIIVVNDFSLENSWSLIIFDNESLPLDIWIVDNNGQSVYKSQNQSCINVFDNVSTPSPWFDEQFLSYMNTTYMSWTTTQCDQDDITNNTGWYNSWQSDMWYQFNSSDIRISLIDYDPIGSDTNNERIGLISFSGDINLSGWKLLYDGKTYQFQSGLVLSGEEYIRTANYVFVNSRPICVSLYYIDNLIDVACYDPTIMSSPVLSLSGDNSTHGELSEEEDSINYNNLQFDILQLDYDPAWSDTDNEKITLQFLWWYSWVILDNLRIRIGTTNKRIYGTLSSGQIITLVGNFQMPNSVHTCVALTYWDIVYDEYCYNPVQSVSSNTSSSLTLSTDTLYSNRNITILWLNYDPDGFDTDRETITLSMTGWQWLVDLSYLYLRFGSTKRSLKWLLYSDTIATIMWNYQLPNSKPTCVDLMEGTHIFDTYCYDPQELDSDYKSWQIDTGMISNLIGKLTIHDINYDPPWKDTSHESVTLTLSTGMVMLTGNLSIRFNTTTKILAKNLLLYDTMIFSGSYGFPNSKPTCVELLYESVTIDEYCYNPWEDDDKQQYDRQKYYQWLQLDWILPNPHGKDVKNNNEMIAFSWFGSSWQILTNHIKVIVGKTSISLSWYVFVDDKLIMKSPKSLTNQPACVRLVVDNNEIDVFCYPQAEEWIKYYHPRLNTWPETIPNEIIDVLDVQGIDIWNLILKRIDKKVCLTYNTIQIRCVSSGESSTSKKNKTLLTLANSYIREVSSMVATNNIDRLSLKRLSQSYQFLSQQIKSWNFSLIDVNGVAIKVTELDRHIELMYNRSPEEYVIDQFSRILFWHEDVDKYYNNLY